MAESDGQERSEEPTSKRLHEAREKGQIPRSRELNTFSAMIIASAAFLMMGGKLMEYLTDLLRDRLTLSREEIFDAEAAPAHFLDAVANTVLAFAPFFALMVLAAVIAGIALGGGSFSGQAIAPKFSKLDPVKGLGRVFSWKGLMEVGKGLGKFFLIGAVAALFLSAQAGTLLNLGNEPVLQALAHMGDFVAWFFLAVSLALIVVVAIDVPFQLWDHKRQLKMTKQEVKEEHKQTEGSPEVKGRQRQIQREMARRRMMAEVPAADVVVTNPTHYAVALRYQQEKMDAPVVVAKGADLVAAQIRSIATEHDVPIVSAPPLARALFHSAELNEPIPGGLYRAVAQVLAYVYHLRQGPMYDHRGTVDFEKLEIPEELRRDS